MKKDTKPKESPMEDPAKKALLEQIHAMRAQPDVSATIQHELARIQWEVVCATNPDTLADEAGAISKIVEKIGKKAA